MSRNGNRLRPDLKEMRQRDAAERQEKYSKKTSAQIIAELDAKYGPGKGAKKVRAKLAKAQETKSVVKTDEEFKTFLENKKKSKKK